MPAHSPLVGSRMFQCHCVERELPGIMRYESVEVKTFAVPAITLSRVSGFTCEHGCCDGILLQTPQLTSGEGHCLAAVVHCADEAEARQMRNDLIQILTKADWKNVSDYAKEISDNFTQRVMTMVLTQEDDA